MQVGLSAGMVIRVVGRSLSSRCNQSVSPAGQSGWLVCHVGQSGQSVGDFLASPVGQFR